MSDWEIGQSNIARTCSRQIFELCGINATTWTAELKTVCRGRDYILNLSKFMSKTVLTLHITIDAREKQVLWMKEMQLLHPLCCCKNQSIFSIKEPSKAEYFMQDGYKTPFFPTSTLLQNIIIKWTGLHSFMMQFHWSYFWEKI